MKSRTCDGITRRDALRVGVATPLGLSLAGYLRLLEASPRQAMADAVIFIHLAGGPSHLDTLDMKPHAPAEERGEFKSISTRLTGLSACEYLPKFASVADRFTLLRGISHSAGAHPQANQYLVTGNRPSPAVEHPSIGSVVAKELPGKEDLPAFVAVPVTEMNAGYLGVAYSPFKTTAVPKPGQPFSVRGLAMQEGVTIEEVRDRNRLLEDLDTLRRRVDASDPLLEGLDRFSRQAQQMVLSPTAGKAFDTSQEPKSITDLFAGDDLSQSLLLACRLVEHGVRLVTVEQGGWDTHLDNFLNHKNKLLPPFDAGIAALVEALSAKGLLERTLVVASGEFGRTPTINKNAGRDHWPRAMWTLMTGGGVQPGQLIGGTDDKGHGPDDGTNIKPDDLAASIYHALGIDPQKEYQTPAGRPVYLVRDGNPIEGLFRSASTTWM